MILFSLCTSSTGLRVLLVIKILIQIICTIIPLIIVYRAFSVSLKNTVDGGKEAKKDVSSLFKSFIAGLIIFLIPTMINYTFNDLIKTDNDFINCINKASLEGVLEAETKEKQEAADKKKQEEQETQKINDDMQDKRKKEIDEAAKKRKEQEEKNPRKSRENGSNNNYSNLHGSQWTQALLSEAKEITDYIRANNFAYGDAPINPAMNHDAKLASCDRCVAWFLYNMGYTNQPESHGVVVSQFPAWCEQNGFTKITNIGDLQAGDVVFVNPSSSGSPGHVYLLGNPVGNGIWERYDCGSVERIRLTGQYSGYSSQPFREGIGSFMYAYRAPKAN